MEIDITDFFENADAYDFSGSVMERGPDAGPQTWANAMREAGASTAATLTAIQDKAGSFTISAPDHMRHLRTIAVLILADMLTSDSGYAIPMVDALWIVDHWLPFRRA